MSFETMQIIKINAKKKIKIKTSPQESLLVDIQNLGNRHLNLDWK